MQSYSPAWNRPPAVAFNKYAEPLSYGPLSMHIETVRKRRLHLLSPFRRAEGRTSIFEWKLMKKPGSKYAFVLPSSSSLREISSGKPLRISGSVFRMKERESLEDRGQYYNSFMMDFFRETVTALGPVLDAIWVRAHGVARRHCACRLSQGKQVIIALVAAMICMTCPTFTVTDESSVVFSNNVALAQSVGQIRQAALFLERLGGGTPTKVLDKLMTVISGQTVVTPETLDQLKSIFEGEKDPKDLQADLGNNVETLWSTTFDVVSQFNPISLLEATGNGIQGLIEGAAERFAAFELSTLVALGERWILWAPFVILPMYWQMTKNKKNKENSSSGVYVKGLTVEVSKDAALKGARVRDELERIQLKASLLDSVFSLGKLAWRANGNDSTTNRRQIDEILARLQDLSPTSSGDGGGAIVRVSSSESPNTQHFLDVDGEWNLIYISQDLNQGDQMQFAQLLTLNIPGFELSNLQQKLWRQGSRAALLATEGGAERLEAKNTAQVRLGPLGVVEISVQGSWENQKDGRNAVVSFQSFYARPLEVLGSRVRDDMPPMNLAIPTALQASGEWKTVYLDSSLRINRGKTGQLFVFRKMD